LILFQKNSGAFWRLKFPFFSPPIPSTSPDGIGSFNPSSKMVWISRPLFSTRLGALAVQGGFSRRIY
jgi:hypothetical protein